MHSRGFYYSCAMPYSMKYIFHLDNRERQKACELLEDCKETIIIPLIGTSGLKIEVSGLEIMNDDPGKYICLNVLQLPL